MPIASRNWSMIEPTPPTSASSQPVMRADVRRERSASAVGPAARELAPCAARLEPTSGSFSTQLGGGEPANSTTSFERVAISSRFSTIVEIPA